MTDPIPNPKAGNGSAKKWLIGCGGCLAVLVIAAILIAVAGGMAWNGLMSASSGAVREVFGPSYKPEGYTSIGLPSPGRDVKHIVLMMDMRSGNVVVGVDTHASPADTRLLKSGDPEAVASYIRRIGAQTGGNGKVNMHEVRVESVRAVKLSNHKQVLMGAVQVASERKGTYSPGAVTLLPEKDNGLVILFALDPRNTSTHPDADFTPEQRTLESALLRIIADSELDDRLQ